MKAQHFVETFCGILFLVLGMSCLLFPEQAAAEFFWVYTGLMALSCIALWYMYAKSKSSFDLAAAIADTALLLFLWFGPMERIHLAVYTFAFYMLFDVFCLGVQFILDVKNHARAAVADGILTVLYLVLLVCSLVFRKYEAVWILRYYGIYLLLQGLQHLLEGFLFSHPHLASWFVMKNWISLPVYFVSFLPGIYLRWMLANKYKKAPRAFDQHKNDQSVDLRVFIHTGMSGEHLLGHMTFSWKNAMYSYGDYDRYAERFFHTIGPGVLFTVDPDEYVNNCCIYEQSVIFEYGLHLSQEQSEKLDQVLADYKKDLIPWQCPLQASRGGRANWPAYETDYASRLWYRTNCQFYKFKSGKWKTYFILGNNCSLFSEDLLSQIGCDIVHKSGIVSPGEYWDYFETEYSDPASNVVYKSWHDASEPATLFPGPA